MSDARTDLYKTGLDEFAAAMGKHEAAEDKRRRDKKEEARRLARLRAGMSDGVDGFGDEGSWKKPASQPRSSAGQQSVLALAGRGDSVKDLMDKSRHHRTHQPEGDRMLASMDASRHHRMQSSATDASRRPPAQEQPSASVADLKVIGAWMLDDKEGGLTYQEAMQKQQMMQMLYESRLASLNRLVGFMILFHRMAKIVQDFWPLVSFGMLGYDMSRTQSIMRVASTAAPVSGSDVRRPAGLGSGIHAVISL